MFDHSFTACAFLFFFLSLFLMETSSRTLIPLWVKYLFTFFRTIIYVFVYFLFCFSETVCALIRPSRIFTVLLTIHLGK